MHYLLTGATGFVGGRLLGKLRGRGDQVTALVRSLERARHLEAPGVRLMHGDITDRASLAPAMAGVDGVFHVAGWYEVGLNKPDLARRINVDGTRNVLETMAELGIPKGVYTSTLAVNSDTRGQVMDENYRFAGEHVSVYDRTKWQAHVQVAEPMMEAGLPLVIVQPGLIYGPGDASPSGRALIDWLRGDLPALPTRAAYCWAHVDDVADGHLLAMDRGRAGQSYIIAGPCHTLIEGFEIAEQVFGIPAPRMRLPARLLRALSVPMSLLDAWLPIPPRYTGEALRVQGGVTYLGTNRKAHQELGYQPRPLAQGLRDSAGYYRRAAGLAPPEPD